MTLEAATEGDLAEILELQKKAFYGQALIYNDFSLPPLLQTIDDLKKEFRKNQIYKIEQNGKIVASIRCYVENDTLYMEKLIVDPDFQNRGIGINLMRLIENKYAPSVVRYALFTGHKSERNLHLYRKLGYQEIRRKIISDDLILVCMGKMNSKKTT